MKYITSLIDLEQLNNKESFYITGNNKFAVRLAKSFDLDITKKYDDLFISINKVFHEEELDDLKKYLLSIKNDNIKGIIFSDFAVYQIALELGMTNLLIYDPTTYIVNYKELEFYEGKIKGVFISPFISLEELKQFKSDKLELYFLGNGRIPLFYSKRKLIKNYCKYHEIEEDFLDKKLVLKEQLRENEYFPIEETSNGTFVYSPYIFSCLDYAAELDNIDYLFIDLVYDLEYIKGDNLGFLNKKVVYRKE